MIRRATIAALMLLVTGSIAAPSFQTPQKGAAPYRNDRLPIDQDRMSLLSAELTVLAAHCGSSLSPAGQRAAAQFLALADSLHSTNRHISELAQQLRRGELPKPPSDKALNRARSIAWKHGEWLAKTEAGKQANLLAACLGDALATADPDHPYSATLRERGEQGRWDGWVADIIAFGGTAKSSPPPDPKTGGNEEPPPPDDPNQTTVPLQIEAAQVLVPVNSYNLATKKSNFGIQPLAIKAWREPLPEVVVDDDGVEHKTKALPQYYVGFRNESLDRSLKSTYEEIREAVIIKHGGLPLRGRGLFSLPEGEIYSWSRDHDSASAAFALLMDSTLSGKSPADGVVVLGRIAADGSMHASWRTWERLRTIATSTEMPGSRIILPRETAPILEGLLVLEKPDFFIRYEVLLAGNLTELAALAAPELTGGLAAAHEEFSQVQTASKNEVIGPFLANRFVRERLANIQKAFPDHASARLALLQGSGERPTRLATPLLAAELRSALAPAKWMTQIKDDDDFNLEAISKTQKNCRSIIDPIEDLANRDDRELYSNTMDLIQSVRTLGALCKRYRESRYTENNKGAREAFFKAWKNFNGQFASLNLRFAELTGEPTEEPKEKKLKRPNS